MKINSLKLGLTFLVAMLSGAAFAQDAGGDVGLGEFVCKAMSAIRARKVRRARRSPICACAMATRLRLAAGAAIKISYTTASRQESWTGPSSFVATSSGGELLKGSKPEISQLPAAVPQKLARVSELMNTSRVGGLVVRSVKAPSASSKEEVAEAVAAYESMRVHRRRPATLRPSSSFTRCSRSMAWLTT
jgi:hypothetical protein